MQNSLNAHTRDALLKFQRNTLAATLALLKSVPDLETAIWTLERQIEHLGQPADPATETESNEIDLSLAGLHPTQRI